MHDPEDFDIDYDALMESLGQTYDDYNGYTGDDT